MWWPPGSADSGTGGGDLRGLRILGAGQATTQDHAKESEPKDTHRPHSVQRKPATFSLSFSLSLSPNGVRIPERNGGEEEARQLLRAARLSLLFPRSGTETAA